MSLMRRSEGESPVKTGIEEMAMTGSVAGRKGVFWGLQLRWL